MNTKLMRVLLLCFIGFSVLALACSSLTPGGNDFSVTQTAIANFLATQQINGDNIEQTAIAQVTQAGSQDFVLTTIAYATQVATQGALNVTPPGFVGSALPPGFGSGSAPEDIPILPDAIDLQVIPNVIQYTTELTKEEAYEFYKKEMPNLGWTEDTSFASSNQYAYNLRYYKSELRTAMIQINIATGVTRIQIVQTGQ